MNQSKVDSRVLRVGAIVAAVVTGALSLGTASAADQCISSQARTAISECPSGALAGNTSKKPQVSFKSAPTPVSLKKRDDVTKPQNPTDLANAAQRDERRAKMQKKSLQLLTTEVQQLGSLLASTPAKSPERPKLIRRLAEGWVEYEAAAFREMTEAEIAKNATNAAKAKQKLEVARKEAIKHYTTLKNQYAKWCQTPNSADPSKSQGCGDEVLYYLAYEYEQAKDLENARTVYGELVEKWKTSKFRPNAYLAFGELFFQDAQSDPSMWETAMGAYEEVIKYPAPDNKVYGYALYKLGYVHWNMGRYDKAIESFKKVIEYGGKFSQLPNASQLAISARRDLIPVYALSGDPKKAYSFFKPLSGDSGSDDDKTFKMMDELGFNYLDTGHFPEAIALYQDLMGRDKGPKWCDYQHHISQATLAMKSGDKDSIVKVILRQFEVKTEFDASGNPAADKLRCANHTAEVASETAMAWHLEAVGSGGVRGTGDAKTMRLASELYAKVVETFKQSDFAQFQFPRIIKEDWPDIMKIKYAMADLLYFQKDWAKCGPAFDSVVAENPTGAQAAEAAFAAVLCYQNIYTERHKDGSDKKGTGNLPGEKDDKKKTASAKDIEKFKPKEFSSDQKGMLTAFNRYICYIKPDAANKEAVEQFVEVKFARARTYFESRHWEEAALGFRDVAMSYPDKEVGIFAAQLYLESLNVLGSNYDPPRSACYEDISNDVPQFIKLYCEGAKRSQNEEQCTILFRIQRDIERLRAESLVKEADAGGANAIDKYRKAGELYLELWEKYGREACEKNDKAGCARNDEVLYNAARAFQAGRRLAKAISVRRTLINPKYNLHETALGRKAVYEIGGNYQAIAVYEEAASWYERFATESPKDEKAASALSDAVVLRLGLGQETEAIRDADQFQKSFSNKAAEAAQIAFAVGAHYADRGDWANAAKRLSGAIGQIDKNATLDVQIQAHALLGRVYDKQRNASKAKGEYDRVRSTWKDPQAMVAKIQAIGGADESEGVKLRRLTKVLTAVGEAYFFFAEEKKAVVDRIVFPEYKGSGERKEVEDFVNTKVVDWQKKKRAAVEEADKEYQKVLELQPSPPPRWVIAAGSRVGQMKGKFVAEFRAAPIPKDWKQNGPSPFGDVLWEEIRGAYYAKLDEVSEPDKLAAKAAYKTCLDRSVKYQYFDEFSRSCEQWLSKNYPAEYHLIDEYRSSPNRVGSSAGERALALNVDGTVFVPDSADDKSAPATPASSSGSSGSATPTAPASKEDDALSRAKKSN
jgi:tetratricopeptide (TPR) repeat protein